jgi:hypothetical protein
VSTTISALFATPSDAEGAITSLVDSGFHRDQITFIAQNPLADSENYSQFDPERGHVEGVKLGAGIGGITGLLAGAVTVFLPDFGAVWVLGASLAGLAVGAGFGAATGTLMGAINEEGIPPRESSVFAEEVRLGRSLLLVRVESAAYIDGAQRILASSGALRVQIGRLRIDEPQNAEFRSHTPRDSSAPRPVKSPVMREPGGSDMEPGATPLLDQQTDGKPRA